MPKYKLHWDGGKTEIIEGATVEKAFMLAGYEGGSHKTLDYLEELKPTFELEYKGPLVFVHLLNTQGERCGKNNIVNTARLQRVECSKVGAILQCVHAFVNRKRDNQEVELRISCDSHQEAKELRDLLIKLGKKFNANSITEV